MVLSYNKKPYERAALAEGVIKCVALWLKMNRHETRNLQQLRSGWNSYTPRDQAEYELLHHFQMSRNTEQMKLFETEVVIKKNVFPNFYRYPIGYLPPNYMELANVHPAIDHRIRQLESIVSTKTIVAENWKIFDLRNDQVLLALSELFAKGSISEVVKFEKMFIQPQKMLETPSGILLTDETQNRDSIPTMAEEVELLFHKKNTVNATKSVAEQHVEQLFRKFHIEVICRKKRLHEFILLDDMTLYNDEMYIRPSDTPIQWMQNVPEQRTVLPSVPMMQYNPTIPIQPLQTWTSYPGYTYSTTLDSSNGQIQPVYFYQPPRPQRITQNLRICDPAVNRFSSANTGTIQDLSLVVRSCVDAEVDRNQLLETQRGVTVGSNDHCSVETPSCVNVGSEEASSSGNESCEKIRASENLLGNRCVDGEPDGKQSVEDPVSVSSREVDILRSGDQNSVNLGSDKTSMSETKSCKKVDAGENQSGSASACVDAVTDANTGGKVVCPTSDEKTKIEKLTCAEVVRNAVKNDQNKTERTGNKASNLNDENKRMVVGVPNRKQIESAGKPPSFTKRISDKDELAKNPLSNVSGLENTATSSLQENKRNDVAVALANEKNLRCMENKNSEKEEWITVNSRKKSKKSFISASDVPPIGGKHTCKPKAGSDVHQTFESPPKNERNVALTISGSEATTSEDSCVNPAITSDVFEVPKILDKPTDETEKVSDTNKRLKSTKAAHKPKKTTPKKTKKPPVLTVEEQRMKDEEDERVLNEALNDRERDALQDEVNYVETWTDKRNKLFNEYMQTFKMDIKVAEALARRFIEKRVERYFMNPDSKYQMSNAIYTQMRDLTEHQIHHLCFLQNCFKQRAFVVYEKLFLSEYELDRSGRVP